MTEQDQGVQTAEDRKEALKTKRSGRICIALFVAFLIVLLSFGRAPLRRVAGDDGSRIDFNLISLLGVGIGVFAVFYLPISFRRILRVSTARKVLGLIGGFGLVVHVLLVLLVSGSGGLGGGGPVATGGRPSMGRSGAEEWVIDGEKYRIAATYSLVLPEGLQYTIEYPYRFRPSDGQMNDRRALEIVFPLMKHAYEQGLYKRVSVAKLGKGKLNPSRIGVALFQKQGSYVGGYRVGLSLADIKKRIEANPTTSTAPAAGAGL